MEHVLADATRIERLLATSLDTGVADEAAVDRERDTRDEACLVRECF